MPREGRAPVEGLLIELTPQFQAAPRQPEGGVDVLHRQHQVLGVVLGEARVAVQPQVRLQLRVRQLQLPCFPSISFLFSSIDHVPLL